MEHLSTHRMSINQRSFDGFRAERGSEETVFDGNLARQAIAAHNGSQRVLRVDSKSD